MKKYKQKQKDDKVKGEKGAITLFVLVAILFFLIILIGLFASSSNIRTSQVKELEKIQENYKIEPNEIDRIYAEQIEKGEEGGYTIKYIKKSDFEAGKETEYNPEEWTNETIIVQIEYENIEITENKKVTVVGKESGTQTEYDYEDIINNRVEVEENSTIIVYNGNSKKEYEITKIDKTAPVLSVITNTSNGNWTNGDVKLSWTITETESGIKEVQYRYNGTVWKELEKESWYGVGETEEKDETIYVRVIDNAGNTSNIESTKIRIDKTKPTVTLGTNGGNYVKPTSGNATIKTTITTQDSGGSGLKTLQYAWSTSNTTEPSTWTTFTSGSTVTKNDITGAGTWYLWTNVIDNAGNRADTIKVSNAFVVN